MAGTSILPNISVEPQQGTIAGGLLDRLWYNNFTMNYKLYVFCPDDEAVIDAIINAAANAGAGLFGSFTHCAFIQRGQGNWFTQQGVQPAAGPTGQMTRAGEVKIEMICPSEKAKLVKEAILRVHPYAEAMIEFVKLEEV